MEDAAARVQFIYILINGNYVVFFCYMISPSCSIFRRCSVLLVMFYTTQGKGPDAKRGIGLGLAICESIVTAHGGSIHAQNRTGGKGAEFTFTLPLKEGEAVEK